ncbi:TetR family transcriptional regulator [Nocardiopsis sp. RSe5-2]|uniref:TetR family transcriptional regulator n=1 Tax=Nocardiopsis endophytica TaxID=3018445 RepID=A0ABT4U7X9_9ACTN|nr:TetR family transcriptional regulator [Nocardiopsis endophytica]MDA2812554.1 TetR family transcriptional regulator [Nocardiopsis endophytica]
MRRSAEETKRSILAAARERFAAQGYDRATVRAIAADAGIDPSMVMRYFGSKEALFATAADFDLAIPDLSRAPRERVGEALAAHFFRRWEEDSGQLRILLRTAVTDEAVTERIRTVLAEQITPPIAELRAAGTDGPAPSASSDAPTRAAMVASQMLGVALCRYVLRLPPVDTMDADDLVARLGPTLQGYLVD